jgi:hypothetical protein
LIDGVAWERVKSVENIGIQAVFDLSVPISHNFVANGIIVHNTLIGLLAPAVLEAQRPVYITEAGLRDALIETEIPKYAQHFNLPKFRAIISYDEISQPKNALLLEKLDPDLLVFDEASNLCRPKSVRVKRVRACLRTRPECVVVMLSGSMTKKSLRDYSHLAKWALGDRSPVPYDFFSLEEWCAALDSSPIIPLAAGCLEELCVLHEHKDHREKYACRLVSSPGVVATSESAIGTSLVIRARRPDVPKSVQSALEMFENTWAFGDEVVSDTLGYYRISQQLSLGFYYRYKTPPNLEWHRARANWAKAYREFMAHRSRPGRDSEALLIQALQRGEVSLEAWGAWERLRHLPEPEVEAVWLSDFMVEDAMLWAKEGDNGLVWYTHRAMGKALAERLEAPQFGENKGGDLARCDRKAYASLVVSIAHRKGHNLQPWNRNLLMGMVGAERFEQFIGRTHRPEQMADCVTVDVYQHARPLQQGWENALRDAAYVETTMRQVQKLNFATKVGF